MPSRTERSLIRLGESTVIVMPKHWIEGMNLEPGDKVEVLYDQDVTIRATKRGADKK